MKRGTLAATIIVPANTGQGLEMLVQAVHSGTMPPERTLTVPVSFPTLDKLATVQAEKARALSAGGSL